MIHLNLSPTLTKSMARHLQPAKPLETGLVWRADLAVIGTAPCVVAQELQTHYVMVLCALDETEFEHFPTLFGNRLWKEALAICVQSGRYEKLALAQQLIELCSQHHLQLDPVPMEEGRITRTIEKLERRYLYDKLPLPKDGGDAFKFGVEINDHRPKSGEKAHQPTPMERFGTLCLELLDNQMERKRAAEDPVIENRNNIIRVDFARHRI